MPCHVDEVNNFFDELAHVLNDMSSKLEIPIIINRRGGYNVLDVQPSVFCGEDIHKTTFSFIFEEGTEDMCHLIYTSVNNPRGCYVKWQDEEKDYEFDQVSIRNMVFTLFETIQLEMFKTRFRNCFDSIPHVPIMNESIDELNELIDSEE